MHPHDTPFPVCIECSKPVSRPGNRCRACGMSEANRKRWARVDDPRRAKLRDRNESVRNGNMLYKDREWLRSHYEDRQMTLRQISKEAECGLRTIARWMDFHNIPTRDNAEAIRLVDRSGQNASNWKGGPPPCPTCGGPKSRTSVLCQECHFKTSIGPANHHWKGGPPKCPLCGGPKDFYSKVCEDCFETPRGPEAFAWKGVGKVISLLRGWSFRHWRTDILSRDHFTCQRCGRTEGTIDAHHIVPFSQIVSQRAREWTPDLTTAEDRAVFASRLMEDDAIRSLDNGLTLCRSCHRIVHRKKA